MSEEPKDPASSADQADRQDVRLSLAGDGEAFARIIRRHQRPVGRLLWRFTRDPARHGELVQEVFVQAYWGLAGYSGRAPLGHWLSRIAVRAGLRLWKSRSMRRAAGRSAGETAPVADPRPGPAEQVEAAEAARRVHDLLARLPLRDRLVLTILYLEGRDVAEAADLLGWTRTMVKVQAWRARGKLRRLLAEGESAED